MKKIFLAVIAGLILVNVHAQTLTVTSVSPSVICGNGSTDTFKYKVSGSNIPANANIVIYESTNPSFNPYIAGQGDSIAGVKGDSIRQPNGCIKILGVFIDACTPVGTNDEAQNEYMTLSSGSGIKVSNLAIDFANFSNNQNPPLNNDINIGASPCLYRSPDATLISNIRANLPCNNTNVIPANSSDSIPANAIILIFTSDSVTINYNMSGLCGKGFPIYVLQSICKRNRGAFSNMNNADCTAADTIRYRVTVAINKSTGCRDTIIYDRCGNLGNGTYAVNLPDKDTSSIANGGIKNNGTNGGCAGIDYTADGLDYSQIVKSSDTTFSFSIPPSFCNTGFHTIKAILNPSGSLVVSNAITFKLVCLDVTAIPVNATICSGQNAVINNSSSDPNAVFSWTISGGANITGASGGSGNQINQTLTNTGASKDSITYSITANDAGCTANKQVKIYVNPLAVKPKLGNDTTYCVAFSRTLSTGNAATVWSTGVTASSITVTQAGTYTATITNSCGNVSDTITLTQKSAPSPINLGNDVALCAPINQVLSTGDATTVWSTGVTASSITVTQVGTYTATITNSCGSVSDAITITQSNAQPKPNLGNDTSFCGVFSKVLSTGNPATVWSTGVTASSITITQGGTYTATITSACGTAKDTIVITQTPGINFDFGTNTTTVCNGGSISLDASSAYDSYLWSTGSASNIISITQPGKYWVDVFKNGCKGTDTITVTQIQPPIKPFIGNDTAFCGTFSKVLSTGNTAANWFNGATQIATNSTSITATQAGTYIAVITNSCGSVADTIVISQTGTQTKPNLGNDTSYCGAFSKTLTTGNAATVWSTGVTASSITVTQAGTYTATITGSCGNISDTITITQGNSANKPFIGNDTTYCGSFSRVLITGIAQTIWTRNTAAFATAASITITQGGTYVAKITDNCGTVSDTIIINNSNAINVNLGKDTLLCAGQSIVLNATVAGNNITYLWNTGEQTPRITVPAQFKRYIVDVSNGICTASDTIIVDSTGVPVKPTLGNDTSFCGDFSKVLFSGDVNTIWSTGVVGIQITVTAPGTYIAENKNQCGNAKDTVVFLKFAAPVINLGKDTTICDSILLNVGNGIFNSIVWSTGDTVKTIIVTIPGLYSVVVTNDNCSKLDSIRIAKDCDYDVYIPTAFSPNGDNLNDVIVPLSFIKGIEVVDFIIFDRWGEKVFETKNFAPNDIANGWNGTYKGDNCAVDDYVYYYIIKLQDGKMKTYKGTFALIK